MDKNNTCKRMGVKMLYPIREKQCIYANLDSFEWGFTECFGLVNLCFENERILMDYVGFGNVKGNAVAQLDPKDSRYTSVIDIIEKANKSKSAIYLERIE